MLSTGLYVIWERHLKSWGWSVFLTLLGVLAIFYSVYLHSHPKAPNPPVWVVLLSLTWIAIGWDVLERRKLLTAPKPGIGSASEPQRALVSPKSNREYPWNVFTIQRQPEVSFSTSPGISHRTKLTIMLTNTTSKDIHIWAPVWESTEVAALEPFASKIRLELIAEGGWKANKWGEETQCIVLPCAQTFQCWVGLTEPATRDGLIRRVQKENTGTLIFPVKIDAKLYEVPIKV